MKNFEDYRREYDAAIAESLGNHPNHERMVKRSVYILACWERDHGDIAPFMPEYRQQLQDTKRNDPELYQELKDGLAIMMGTFFKAAPPIELDDDMED